MQEKKDFPPEFHRKMKQVTGKQAPLFPFGTLEIVVAFLLLHGTSIKRREVENVSDSSANPKVAPPPRRRERERYDPPPPFSYGWKEEIPLVASWKKNSIPASPSGAGRRRQHLLLTTSAGSSVQVSQPSPHRQPGGFASLIRESLPFPKVRTQTTLDQASLNNRLMNCDAFSPYLQVEDA